MSKPTIYPFDTNSDVPCPVCNTSEVKDSILIPVAGSEDGEFNYVAKQVHVDCILEHLVIYPQMKVLVCNAKHLEYEQI